MKSLFAIAILIVLFSCHNHKKDPNVVDWVLQSKSKYVHTYTKDGYLDSTFITQLKYKNGVFTDSSLYLITRKYDHGLLINASQFLVTGRNMKLINETTRSFDEKGKIKFATYKKDGNIVGVNKYNYDSSGLLKDYIDISPVQANNLTGEVNLEDVHGKLNYDSTQTFYFYDNSGKLLKTVNKDLSDNLLRTDYNLYSGKEPIASYSINIKGDTIQTIKFQKDKKFTKQIFEIKNTAQITMWTFGDIIYETITKDLKNNSITKVVNRYGVRDLSEVITYRSVN